MSTMANSEAAQAPPEAQPRIAVIDVVRGIALMAMASYHFTWDLEFFGYAEPGMTSVGGWKLYARCIASSFLFLAGVSLYLAHGRGIRWPGFRKRLAMVVAAAAAISVATYIAVPHAFIFFGILHSIALASLLGLAFLRLPWFFVAVVAALIVAMPNLQRFPLFDHPWLWWVGLSTMSPRSNDYVPVFPWFGAVLFGIAAGMILVGSGLAAKLADARMPSWSRPLAFAGRHSLAFYLIHQPVLIGCIWLAAQIAPPTPIPPQARFLGACDRSCQQTRDTDFCARYCVCMLDRLEREGKLAALESGDQSDALQLLVAEASGMCSVATDTDLLGEEPQ